MSDLSDPQFLAGGAAAAPSDPITDQEDALAHAERVIGERAAGRIGAELTERLHNAGVSEFYIFGGACLRGAPSDIDLAPAFGSGEQFRKLADKLKAEPEAQCHALALQVVKHIYTKGLEKTVGEDGAYLGFLGVPDAEKPAG